MAEKYVLSEEERAARAEAMLGVLHAQMREALDQGKISRDEAKAFLLDKLLLDQGDRDAPQKLSTTAKPKAKRRHGPSGGTRAARLERLARAYNNFPQPAGTKGANAKKSSFLAQQKAFLDELNLHPNSIEALANLISRGEKLERQREHVREAVSLLKRSPSAGAAGMVRGIVKDARRKIAVDGNASNDESLKEQVQSLEFANAVGIQAILDWYRSRKE